MTVTLLYSITGFLLFLMGICGLVFHHSLIRRALALNVTASGIFLFIVAQAFKGERALPDPVPHGLVLTGIVIGASATALMLYLIGVSRFVADSEDDSGEEEP